MFYKEEEINSFLKCADCKQKLNEPKILPCGEIICSSCISKITNQEFKCFLCSSIHLMPNQGFPTCKILSNLLKVDSKQIYRGEQAKTLETNLEFLNEKIKKLNFEIENGVDKIKTVCIELRNEVQLATELAIQEINSLNETSIERINKYEKECINIYNNKTNPRKKEIDKSLDEIEKFQSKWNEYLKNLSIKDQEIMIANEEAEQLKSKLEKAEANLQKITFNDKIMKYQKNLKKMDENILGTLVLKSIGSIDFKNVDFIDLSSVLNNIHPSYFNNTRIECFDNGNTFITYAMNNVFQNYLTINKQKSVVKTLNDTTINAGYFVNISKFKNQILIHYYLSNGYHHLKILDENLTTLANSNIQSQIGAQFRLLGANETNIFVQSTSNNMIYLLNQQLQYIQQIQNSQYSYPTNPFYFPTDLIKLTKIDGKYIWLNSKTLNILSEKDGIIIRSIETSSNKFEINSRKEIVLICNSSKKLKHFNLQGELIEEQEIIDLPTNFSTNFVSHSDEKDNINIFDKTIKSLAILSLLENSISFQND